MKTTLFAIFTELTTIAYENNMLGFVRPDYAAMLDTLFDAIGGHIEPSRGRLRRYKMCMG